MKVLAAGLSLLMTLLLTSSFAAEQGNSSETKDSKASKIQKIMEKVDDMWTWMTGKPHDKAADNSANFQLMMLTNKFSTLEAQLIAETQTTRVEMQATRAQLQSTEAKLHTALEQLKQKGSSHSGSSFVRWGKKSCPGNTSLVYTGVAGGKHYSYAGSATNRLCLSRQPQFDNTQKPSYYGEIYGSEYYYVHGHHSNDVPCSVCRAHQSSTIMIPGTMTCPPAWSRQYSGHITSGSQYSRHQASEFVCLDQDPEDDNSGVQSQVGSYFAFTIARCGSLPCPPYFDNKVVTCVVCSK